MNIQDEIKYQEAKKRVQKIKGFYTHLLVYILVNLMIIVLNFKDLAPGESYFQFKNFMTAFFGESDLLLMDFRFLYRNGF
ncbi:2TM domain-containing protein [Flavobacterium piscinae]|uniref:2TM domain-containing protein n=1 Tax=Flavobacterium piscinae TaxID=2506424 RepID=UPI0037094EED